MLLLKDNDHVDLEVYIYYKNEDGILCQQRCRINEKTGKGEESGRFRYSGKEEKTDFVSIVTAMLKYIVD